MSSRAQPCRHCGRPVVIRMTQAGKSWPFDNDLVSVDADLPEELRYIPAPGRDGVVMIPVVDVSDQRLVGVRWYAVRHICAEWLRTRQANRRGDVNRAMSVDWSGDTSPAASSTGSSGASPSGANPSGADPSSASPSSADLAIASPSSAEPSSAAAFRTAPKKRR